MCTITFNKPILQTATEDIVVYKYMYGPYKANWFTKLIYKTNIYFKSFCYNKKYRLNKIYTTKLDNFEVLNNRSKYYYSKRGFYSYKDIINGNFKCIIPKGAKYYLCKDCNNYRWIYHSNKIKIIEML